jgi:putative oxidoreductase
MAGHGLQKLTHSLGGHGLEAAGESFDKIGFKPGHLFALATGVTETTGGVLMVAGLGTPVACAMISGVMAGAIAKVHYKNGFWVRDRGYEYNLEILAATFAIAGAGGGALTLDGLRGKKHRGFGWALAQLAVGVAAAAGALAIADRQTGDRWQDAADRWADSLHGEEDAKDATGANGSAPVDLTAGSSTGEEAAEPVH